MPSPSSILKKKKKKLTRTVTEFFQGYNSTIFTIPWLDWKGVMEKHQQCCYKLLKKLASAIGESVVSSKGENFELKFMTN